MLSNIIKHIINIFTFAGRAVLWGLSTLYNIIMFLAMAMCGLIGWVGLLIPHISRMIFGNDNRYVIPSSIVLGSIFMLVIDTAARCTLPSEVPASILTAVIGAPFFIFLLRKSGGVKI